MNIVIVSFFDDNFGDTLIGIAFEALLKVALENHGLERKDYYIDKMYLKEIDYNLLTNADAIFFSGLGGGFGFNYMRVTNYYDEITKIAEERNIPVMFCAVGLNNIESNPENDAFLRAILQRKSVKSFAARDNFDAFEEFVTNCDYNLDRVCDPAVWTQYVYGLERPRASDIIGINVIRGGIFRDNHKPWDMGDELKYLADLRERLKASSKRVLFYTNGSIVDNNTLRYFAQKYEIPNDEVVYLNTTREVVETISKFRAVVAFRMHSLIIAYSFRTPAIGLAWNKKIDSFCQSTNQSERALAFEDWNGEMVFNKLNPLLVEPPPSGNDAEYKDYLMLIYRHLYETIARNVLAHTAEQTQDIYDFDKVASTLVANSHEVGGDEFDLRFKLERGESQYLLRFMELRKKSDEISKLKKKLATLKQDNEDKQKQISKQADELKRINSYVIVRILKYGRRKMRKLTTLKK